MEHNAEKINVIRRRTNATYEMAKNALYKAAGNVVEAIADLDRTAQKTTISCITTQELCRIVADVIRRGNASRIIVRNQDRLVADIPVTLGVLGIIIFPWAAFLSAVALLASTWTLEIHRPLARDNGKA
jgi:hypothetical protein